MRFFFATFIVLFVLGRPIFSEELNGIELIENGDFEAGNSGFQSDYIYDFYFLDLPGYFYVLDDASLYHSTFAACGDKTTGSGKMMFVNGDEAPDKTVWSQNVGPFLPGIQYEFSFWATSIVELHPARFDVLIDGEKANESEFLLRIDTCDWNFFFVRFEFDAQTYAEISIIDNNNQFFGNDFALDDISCQAVCGLVSDAGFDKIVCEGESALIGKPAQNGIEPYFYEWTPSGFVESPYEATTRVFPEETTEFVLKTEDSYGCVDFDTALVEVEPIPDSKITASGSTTICPCTSVELFVTECDSCRYRWSTGDTTSTTIVKEPGTVTVEVYSPNECMSSSEIEVDFTIANSIIEIDDFEANIGETVTVPIRIGGDYDPELCGAYPFSFKLGYDATVLYPVNASPACSGRFRTLEYSGVADTEILAEIDFLVLLGESDISDLTIEELSWGCDEFRSTFDDGSVTAANVCKKNGVRLFRDTGKELGMSHPYFDESSSSLRTTIYLIEKAPAEVAIYDVRGVPVKISREIIGPGEFDVIFEASDLAEGAYAVILRTPTEFLTERFILID